MKSFIPTLIAVFALAPASASAVAITSGSLAVRQTGTTIAHPINLNAAGLSIINVYPFSMTTPPGACPGMTCTYDFAFSGNQSYSFGSVVYNGTTYVLDASTILNLSLNVVGPSITVPVTRTGTPPAHTDSASTSGHSFSMTGTATLTVNGNPVFTQLALTGSGLASASWLYDNSTSRTFGNKDWVFAPDTTVPEPASITLITSGLLAAALLRRRSKQGNTPQ